MVDFKYREFDRVMRRRRSIIVWTVVYLWMVFSAISVHAFDQKTLSRLGLQEISGQNEAPDFTLLSLEGKQVSLKDYRGQVVFINFWATWCEPCKKEFPEMEKLYSEYKAKGLTILAVSIDVGGEKDVKAFAEKMGATFPILLSTKGTITSAYWTWGTPTSYLIDRNGKILGRAIGPRDWNGAEYRTAFDALLKG
jgi:peroxiredoxin